MINHKHTNIVCIAIVLASLLLTGIILYVKVKDPSTKTNTIDKLYETKLFDDSIVHSINIVIGKDDWDKMQTNASDKEYTLCNVIVDGEAFDNVAIRTKGNSSLSQVTTQDSERYSFKLEFDHYNEGNTCWGLDKLSLNNIIQDSTNMKDYLCYDMMNYMGVAAPLTSYVSVSVNGEKFGLYLAVEGIEESFVERNYGSDSGLLYKPESMDMGNNYNNMDKNNIGSINMEDMKNAMKNGYFPEGKGARPDFTGEKPDGTVEKQNGTGEKPDITDEKQNGTGEKLDESGVNNPNIENSPSEDNMPGKSGFMTSSGKSDVALQYTDDKYSSYSNIFSGAIFDITNTDKDRLISCIKQINEGSNLDEVLNLKEVLTYFAVHNFVDNFDSYTGSLMHNYYLYESNGKISIVAWDYNLAFGGFTMASDSSNTDQATTLVNYPIDTPVSGTTMEDRPLLNSLFTNEEYLNQYHSYLDEFISEYFESGHCKSVIEQTEKLISSYVKEDATAFYTYDEFEKGVETLKEFCDLRTKSVREQLSGTIPATTDGQKESDNLINASSISIAAMGGSDMNKNGNFQQSMFGAKEDSQDDQTQNSDINSAKISQQPNSNGNSSENGQLPSNDENNMNNSQKSRGFGNAPYNNQENDNANNSNMDFAGGGDTGIKVSNLSVIMIVISVLILLFSLGFVKIYKRKKRIFLK